jgi:hypothetical protein
MSPVLTAPLYQPLHDELIALLEGLDARDWERPTIASSWQVRDVVAHLLEVDLRRLSVGRDGHRIDPGRRIDSYADLVAFLNRLNAEWIVAARRFSPRVLIDLLRTSGPALARLVADLPPFAAAPFAVAWAGEAHSENWFDIGRDYTERWHHQMQIRDAVGAPGLLEARWLLPLLDLSMRALPRAYARVATGGDVSVTLRVGSVASDPEAAWTLRRLTAAHTPDADPQGQPGWQLWRGALPDATTTVRLDAETAWRLLYNAMPAADARQRAVVEGDPALADPLFAARAVMV